MSASLRRSSTSVWATSSSLSVLACSTICDFTWAYGGIFCSALLRAAACCLAWS